jgi:hypothetical protein
LARWAAATATQPAFAFSAFRRDFGFGVGSRGCAHYAGLRLGELRALRVIDIDLAAGVISVEYGWDPSEGQIELKTRDGRRRVPISAILRDYLAEHLARIDRQGTDLIFGRTAALPFVANRLQERADEAWEAAGLERITPHPCRHTFASLMIAAGVHAKALSTFMGHANISITLDTYGHLMPGSEEEAAGLLDAYLTAQRGQAEETARAADGVLTGTSTGTREADTAQLQDVDRREDDDPHHVDEVPVDPGHLDAEVLLGV